MKEVKGNLFNAKDLDAVAIATNGFVSQRKGEGMLNVMGLGSAGEAKRRWPSIPGHAAYVIKHYGNVPSLLTQWDDQGRVRLAPVRYGDHVLVPMPIPTDAPVVPYHILTFPTKPSTCSREELLPHYAAKHPFQKTPFPGWMAQSQLSLIKTSAEILVEFANQEKFERIGLPRVGCGAGALNWPNQVQPLLAEILDDRFIIFSY